jgi:hypothetical protein
VPLDPDQIVRVFLRPAEVAQCVRYARDACIGGVTHVRGNRDDIEIDQIVGQLGTAAGHVQWFGRALGWVKYVEGRERANLTPTKGDGGSDILGANVDFKASLMRKSQDPLTYRLPVRRAERHKRWVYVLVLIPNRSVEKMLAEGAEVLVVGWSTAEMLPIATECSGQFAGAYVRYAVDLEPMPVHPDLVFDPADSCRHT